MHLVQLAQPVQFGQVAPDGGFAGVQRLAQFLHRHGALAVQLFHDQAEAFFCQHRHSLSFGLILSLTVYDRLCVVLVDCIFIIANTAPKSIISSQFHSFSFTKNCL